MTPGRLMCLSCNLLTMPKSRAGTRAPNVYHYHTAAILVYIVDCLHRREFKLWVQLEMHMASWEMKKCCDGERPLLSKC